MPTTAEDDNKPIHTLILDTGPIIRNHPSVSSLLAQSAQLITVPAIISEIRDAATRSRVQTTLTPFLTLRQPRDESVRFVTDFARRTGDAAVLSRVDLLVAALAYEVEIERNGGDWRLRKVPGQKGVNGKPPGKAEVEGGAASKGEGDGAVAAAEEAVAKEGSADAGVQPAAHDATAVAAGVEAVVDQIAAKEVSGEAVITDGSTAGEPREVTTSTTGSIDTDASQPGLNDDGLISEDSIRQTLESTTLDDQVHEDPAEACVQNSQVDVVDQTGTVVEEEDEDEDSSDGGEWITPSNLSKRRAADQNASANTAPAPKMQVATLTTDNALQNLLLQVNLNLLNSDLSRISQLRTTLLRCHACFMLHKTPDLSFCTRCGKPTLTRVTVTTDAASGQVRVHLKKNMQWSHRGDRYSIPKPVHGSANGRQAGGGKNGWGNDLVLAGDQKEWMRQQEGKKREEKRREKNGMDEDYLPGILTGRREGGRQGGRLKVGAGKNVNSKRR